MTTMSWFFDWKIGVRAFAFIAVAVAAAPLAAQNGGKSPAYSGPATYPSNPRSANPVRQVSGPAEGQPQSVYGPQPANAIKEPGKGTAPAAGQQQQQQMPLPVGRVVPLQPGQAGPVQAPAPLRAPSWFPLEEEHQKYLDEILLYWEQKSDVVERYQCNFKRWDYDPVFGPKPGADGIDVPKSYSEGVLRYKKPDKGSFKVEVSKVYTPGKGENARATYEKQAAEMNEHWVCDGKSVFEFDGRKKQLIERPLPPEMQGKSIADGPLPFMFGAKAATIKQRYWIRVITPPNAKNEYWLEAHPKSRQDAANFKLVQVIIDETDFLPKKLTIFAPNYDPRTNPAKTAYVFEDRKSNWNETLEIIMAPFQKSFDKPAAPFGWQKVVDKPDATLDGPPPAEARPQGPPGNQAKRPATSGPSALQAIKPQNSKSVK